MSGSSRAQSAWPASDDPAKLRFIVQCTQLLEDYVTTSIGPTGKPLFFALSGQNRSKGEVWAGGGRKVLAVLANEINLTEDEVTAKQILDRAARFAEEKCHNDIPSVSGVDVEVRHGNPATFTEDKFTGVHPKKKNYIDVPSPIYELFKKDYPVVALTGSTRDRRITLGEAIDWSTSGSWGESSYHNRDKEQRDEIEAAKKREVFAAKQRLQQAEAERAQRARQAEVARAEQAQRVAQVAAAQKVQADIQARSDSFVTTNGVKHFVTVKQLAANPFVYQGQVVAVYAVFEQMNSATEAFFSATEFTDALLVSGIPSARFTQARSMVMLAGRVLGKQEMKLPLLGPTLVPHLSFVGSAFCRKQHCADYEINIR
jgi:hypothetical protein